MTTITPARSLASRRSLQDTVRAGRTAIREARLPAAKILGRVGLRPAVDSESMTDRERPFIGSVPATTAVAVIAGALILWVSGAGLYPQTVVGLGAGYLISALGYNVVLGNAGQFAFCQSAFMAVGAYGYAVAQPRMGTWPALVIAVAVVPLVGAIVGIAVLRTSEIYLALITLAFAQAVALAIELWQPTGGDNGILVAFGGSQICVITVVVAAVALLATQRLVRSPFGLSMAMIRTDEAAATAMGVNVTRVRVTAFALSGLYGGISGILIAAVLTFVTPTNFTLELSLMLLTMIVVGGVTSVWGTVFGVLIIYLVRQEIPSIGEIGSYIDAGVLFLILMSRPRGLATLIRLRTTAEADAYAPRADGVIK